MYDNYVRDILTCTLTKKHGLYYLQSRYYVPEWGRFLNADGSEILEFAQGNLIGANLFAYCKNNPINMQDKKGYIPAWVAGAAFSAIFTYLIYIAEYQFGIRTWNWWTLTAQCAASAAFGAINIGFLGSPLISRFYKVVGVAETWGFATWELKTLRWIFRARTYVLNMVFKSFDKIEGESWATAVKRFIDKYF